MTMQRGKHGEGALEAYIEALSRLKSSGELNAKGMERIAREIGFSTEDFVMAKAQAAKHGTRAKKFLERGLHEAARKEAEAALALEPLSVEYRLLAAKSLAGLYTRSGSIRIKDEAAAILRGLIAERPDLDEAYDLMAKLEEGQSLLRIDTRTKPRAVRGTGRGAGRLAAALSLVAIIGVIVVILASPDANGSTIDQPFQVTANVAPKKASVQVVEAPHEKIVPVIQSDELAASYPLRIADSRFIPYKDAWSYKLSAMASSKKLELTELKLSCKGYAADGSLMFSRVASALQDIDAAIRPGELAPFDISVYEKEAPPDLERVELGVSLAKTAYTPASYLAEPELSLAWDAPAPAGMALEARLRADTSSGSYATIVFALKNTGTREIKHLKLRMEWLAGTHVVDSVSALHLMEWRAPLLPGDVAPRVFRRKIDKGSYDSWRLAVEEIK